MAMSPLWQMGLLSGAVAQPQESVMRGLLDHGGHEGAGGLMGDPSNGLPPGFSHGFSPGPQGWLTGLGSLAGAFVPGAGLLAGAINGGLGLNAGAEQAQVAGVRPSFADNFYAATGFDLFGSDLRRGIGGYGDFGRVGGLLGAMNFEDPGVMGLARAQEASRVSQKERGGIPGRSGSQNAGGRTVGNNRNDRSGRNPGASRDPGAGGRLGGGV